ncbi:MAG TPA: hypothetical protein VH592_23645 [Gemmataceae bacterium]|jgi:hypothetical protein
MTEKQPPHRVDSQPTDRDRENARIRQEIARRQAEEYAEAERLALAILGPGWKPWMKLSLLDSGYHRTGNTEAAATVYKVYRGEEKLTENAVYLRRMSDGQVRHSCDYEALVAELLREPHPARTIEVRGQQVPCPHYCVCWSPLERYEPRSAEQLAALRASRERNKAEREQKKWAADHPLLAWAESIQAEEEVPEEKNDRSL